MIWAKNKGNDYSIRHKFVIGPDFIIKTCITLIPYVYLSERRSFAYFIRSAGVSPFSIKIPNSIYIFLGVYFLHSWFLGPTNFFF